MSFGTFLFTLLIKPLELIFEIIYSIANSLLVNPGLSIIALSLTMNFLVLPLYMRADAMQAEEQKTEAKLKEWVSKIKRTFKGDERFMMLQAYYRLNGYKPTQALRGSLSLFLEVPFFIAAYHFLSHLELLNGVTFGPIKDLGAPDGMIVIKGIAINLLPILMTSINIVSGAIYTKGSSIKTKVQLYAMALVFLVFLYKSPAGLVFYWTLNNLFSLIKNIFYKIKNPRRVLGILASLVGLLVIGFAFKNTTFSNRQKIFVVGFGVLLQIPFVLSLINRKDTPNIESKHSVWLFILATTLLAVLVGITVPSAVIASSTAEFVDIMAAKSPLNYVLYCFIISVGLFVVWLGIFYYLASDKGKKIFTEVIMAVVAGAIVDYMFFGKNLGTLSSQLSFENPPAFTHKVMLLNLMVIVVILVVCVFIYNKFYKVVAPILLAGLMGLMVLGVKDINTIKKDYIDVVKNVDQSGDIPTIQLSKNGKNVVVIMMDRMITYYIPYIMNEKPELVAKFDGFTYYPNCATYGRKTNAGTPGLFGGYEYVPEEMNKRDKELLVDKHDEALKVMPVLFDENGYDVTVGDPSYAGYDWVPDINIYNDYPDIKAYLMEGKINSGVFNRGNFEDVIKRNFICYSIMKVSPVMFQRSLYNNGNYYSTLQYEEMGVTGQSIEENGSVASGLALDFINAYNVLHSMKGLTRVVDDGSNTFFMMSNNIPHTPCLLKEPEYEPSPSIDNTKFDEENHIRRDADGNTIDLSDQVSLTHYQVDVCGLQELGAWFDYLREKGVWDNTRIIIVSDHGYEVGVDENMFVEGKIDGTEDHMFDMLELQSTLMVKDFDATGFTYDDSFMTNADVPTLATKDIIDNPTNPFTGKSINSDYKTENGVKCLFVHNWDVGTNNGTQFLPEEWFSVHDDVRDPNNWKYEGYY